MKRLSFVKGAFVAACLATGTSFAHVPQLSDVAPVLVKSEGKSSDMSGWLEVHNPNRQELYAVARSVSSPLGYVVQVGEERLLVKPDDTVRVPFRMAIRGDGRYHVVVPVDLVGADGSSVGQVEGTLDVEVRDGVYAVGTYEKLFVQPDEKDVDEDGRPVYIFRAAPPPTEFPDSDDYKTEHWSPEQLGVITDEMIKDITPGTGEEVESPTLPLPPPRDTSLQHVEREDYKFTQKSVDERIKLAMEATRTKAFKQTFDDGLATGMTAIGSFNYTGLDGKLHPAWGWRVYAHVLIGNKRVPVAKTNVQANGNWSLSIPAIPTVFPVVVTYEPRNVYYTLASTDGTYYVFSSGVQHTPADNKVLNEFTQAAYTAKSVLAGLGEVHRDGMNYWETLKSKGEGIDPVRDSSITVYFPNNVEDCGMPDGKPWSCAWGNEIWIKSSHATSKVLQHELGHQLMFKYWDGGSPSGSGKPHNWDQCVNAGVALSEGFADFMLVWANLNINQNPSTFGFTNIEHPESFGACTTKNQNEAWVAANFWDFYDSLSDNKDTIHYFHTGATPKLFLNHEQDSMDMYLGYFLGIASPQHQFNVISIFGQNHQW